jgi:hypothetical protein
MKVPIKIKIKLNITSENTPSSKPKINFFVKRLYPK